jgi:hypothetical protein
MLCFALPFAAASIGAGMGFASSGVSADAFGMMEGVLARDGMTARMAASEKTQPHCRSARKGTVPDISLSERGHANGIEVDEEAEVEGSDV